MLASVKAIRSMFPVGRTLASRFSTLNPVEQANRTEEVRAVLNSVWIVLKANRLGNRALHKQTPQKS